MQPGQMFARYELIAEIGKGDMGEVWRAHDTRLDRIVAMKFMNTKFNDHFDH